MNEQNERKRKGESEIKRDCCLLGRGRVNVRMYKECVLAKDILFARHRCQVRRRYHRHAYQDTFDIDSDPKHREKG